MSFKLYDVCNLDCKHKHICSYLYFKWLNCSCVQVNELIVPYAASVHGMYYNNNVNNGTSISDLFIKAIMYNEERQRRDGAALLTRLRAQ